MLIRRLNMDNDISCSRNRASALRTKHEQRYPMFKELIYLNSQKKKTKKEEESTVKPQKAQKDGAEPSSKRKPN